MAILNESRSRGELALFVRKVAVVVAAILGLALLWAVRHVLLLVFIAAMIDKRVILCAHVEVNSERVFLDQAWGDSEARCSGFQAVAKGLQQ